MINDLTGHLWLLADVVETSVELKVYDFRREMAFTEDGNFINLFENIFNL